MTQYLIMLFEDEARWEQADEAFAKEVYAQHMAFGEKYGAQIKGGNALQPAASARTVRSGVVTDGPFAETKEVLNGYYLVEAADLDEALAMAADVPVQFGGVEVRPTMTFDL